MAKKLSPAQIDLIKAMQRGVRVTYSPGIDGHYWRNDNHKRCTVIAHALIDRSLVEQGEKSRNGSFDLKLIENPMTKHYLKENGL